MKPAYSDWAYLAGLIEGDGSFTINNSDHAYCRLTITAHERANLLPQLQKIFGGKIHKQLDRGQFHLCWSGHEAAHVSENILSHMRSHKKPQAELCIEYAKRMPGRGGKWDRTWLDWAYQRMKELKR